jgi:hypothetical protein
MSQPPQQMDAGIPSSTPLTVRLRATGSANQDVELGILWGVVSLVRVGSNEDVIPYDVGVLSGPRLVDSVHPIDQLLSQPAFAAAHAENNQEEEILQPNGVEAEGEEVGSGAMSFPAFAIRDAGLYNIRVTLYRMGSAAHASAGGGDDEIMESPVASVTGAVAVQAIDTDLITVV